MDKRVKILKTGEETLVYKSKLRGTWIRSDDMVTEYDQKEVKEL
ncbi:MAG: hypothetical protein AAF600_13140 [Bacteroidota bacterium]